MRFAILVGLTALWIAPPADACSCRFQTPQRALRQADVVLAGRVEEVIVIDKVRFEPRIIVKFSVGRVWKGDIGAEFTMHTYFEASTCTGFFPELAREGEELLVFANEDLGKDWKTGKRWPDAEPPEVQRQDLVDAVANDATIYTTNICSGTVRWTDAGFAVHYLREHRTPPLALTMTDAPEFDESQLPPEVDGLPMACWPMRMENQWKVLEAPPKEVAALQGLIATRFSNAAAPFDDRWFEDDEGRLGLCRIPGKGATECGAVAAVFLPPGKKKGDEWMVWDSAEDPCEDAK